MQTYQFKKVTDRHGNVTISGLPPSEELTILVLPTGRGEWRDRMEQLMKDVREHHSFAEMDKDQIQKQLRKARQDAWDDRHGH
jgi:hypothetical protein